MADHKFKFAVMLPDAGCTMPFKGHVTIRDFVDESCHGGPTLMEMVHDAIGEWLYEAGAAATITPTFTVKWIRRVAERADIGIMAYTVGTNYRSYGGPEEGGWWYTSFHPDRVIRVPRRFARRAEHWLTKYVDACNAGRNRMTDDERTVFKKGVHGHTPRPHYC